ncbi:putative lipase ROG1 isoform X2 [Ziziphus jujuba]|uniref:Lipase ROG1 isoform X2 n=1 Tax=Ziziphus jujuba TaxID=326968 RepID=A0A6P3ZEF0_ZIZJJ|nr:putative lipase ROG1 isoform X2 [Ziziphus jujuba]
MIASNSPLKSPAPGPTRVPNPTPIRCRFACFTPGFRSVDQKLCVGPTTSTTTKMYVCYRMSAGCFRDNPRGGLKFELDSGGEDIFDAATAANAKAVPQHLVVMVNGIVGSSSDWRYAAEQFVEKLPDKVFVHRSACNYARFTFDGVDLMGQRLANEVLAVVRKRPELKKISFVAHSLGGLIARYAVGMLYECVSTSEPSGHNGNCSVEEDTNNSSQCIKQLHHATIAGLEPINFITFATPHLGSRGHRQLPFLCGLPFLERKAPQTAHLIAGRSGKHLFLTDNDDGKRPLLLRMVNDTDDLKFMSALRVFKRRVAYANANYDHMVGWRTSSIRRQSELPKSNQLVTGEKYPHVVYVERENFDETCSKASTIVGDQKVDLEEMMIRGLTQVPWERVDVSFQKSKQRYIAHSTIQESSASGEELLVKF